jgi:hypothetical protein
LRRYLIVVAGGLPVLLAFLMIATAGMPARLVSLPAVVGALAGTIGACTLGRYAFRTLAAGPRPARRFPGGFLLFPIGIGCALGLMAVVVVASTSALTIRLIVVGIAVALVVQFALLGCLTAYLEHRWHCRIYIGRPHGLWRTPIEN